MKLRYWIADCLTDHECYSIRDKTKKECLVQLARQDPCNRYGEPRKVIIEYDSAFDLMLQATGEGGLDEYDD